MVDPILVQDGGQHDLTVVMLDQMVRIGVMAFLQGVFYSLGMAPALYAVLRIVFRKR